jgi:hypothetical protein
VVDFVAIVAFSFLEGVVVLEGVIDYISVFGLLYLSGILLGFNFGIGFVVWLGGINTQSHIEKKN